MKTKTSVSGFFEVSMARAAPDLCAQQKRKKIQADLAREDTVIDSYVRSEST